jgi:hypothetical protein
MIIVLPMTLFSWEATTLLVTSSPNCGKHVKVCIKLGFSLPTKKAKQVNLVHRLTRCVVFFMCDHQDSWEMYMLSLLHPREWDVITKNSDTVCFWGLIPLQGFVRLTTRIFFPAPLRILAEKLSLPLTIMTGNDLEEWHTSVRAGRGDNSLSPSPELLPASFFTFSHSNVLMTARVLITLFSEPRSHNRLVWVYDPIIPHRPFRTLPRPQRTPLPPSPISRRRADSVDHHERRQVFGRDRSRA